MLPEIFEPTDRTLGEACGGQPRHSSQQMGPNEDRGMGYGIRGGWPLKPAPVERPPRGNLLLRLPGIPSIRCGCSLQGEVVLSEDRLQVRCTLLCEDPSRTPQRCCVPD